MSVEVDTETPAALASEDQPPAISKRKYTRRPVAAPRALVWVCEVCEKAIRGAGAGFAYVDLRQTVTRDSIAGAQRATEPRSRAPWHIAHAECVPDVVSPLNPFFRVWVERVAEVDSLLDAMAQLSRQPWHGATDWGGLVRRVLADTETAELSGRARVPSPHEATGSQGGNAEDWHGTVGGYTNHRCRCGRCTAAAVEDSAARRDRIRALAADAKDRRTAEGLADDDPRHGTTTGYGHCGCRCERCVAANTEASRIRGQRRKAKRAAERAARTVTAGATVVVDETGEEP